MPWKGILPASLLGGTKFSVFCITCPALPQTGFFPLRAASFGIEYHPASLGTDSESLFTLFGTAGGVLLKRRAPGPEGAGVPF